MMVKNENGKEISRGQRIEQLMKSFMKVPTHTGTAMENNATVFYQKWFLELQQIGCDNVYFGCYRILNDVFGREISWGLVKGQGDRTLVLIHHSDTADILDFGSFEPWAYEPEELEKRLLEAVDDGKMSAGAQFEADIRSGDWVFGRGGCDMKAGAAIEMGILEHYARLAVEGELKVNLLMLGLPDEENLSAGMRSAPLLLKDLKEKYNLDYQLMINTEPHEREKPEAGILYAGSVGKMMPVCYVKGVAAHVGQVFQGLNPIFLLSEIIARTEMVPAFMEAAKGEAVTPPLWLYCKDRKQNYDVSLPLSAAGYMSVLSLGKTPQEWLSTLLQESEIAFETILNKIDASCRDYEDKTGTKVVRPQWRPKVVLFSELIEKAIAREGNVFLEWFEQEQISIQEKLAGSLIDMPEATCQLIEGVLARLDEKTPVVVWSLSPPYYPCVGSRSNPDVEAVAGFNGLLNMLSQESLRAFDETYEVRDHFFGICDLSYAMSQDQDEQIMAVQKNMPLWGQGYSIPFQTIGEVSMPVINIGPWGKDFHKLTERVLKQDVYERTPYLIMKTIEWVSSL